MLRQNGKEGEFTLTAMGKMMAAVFATLISAATVSAVGAFIQIAVISSDIQEIKASMSDIERRQVAGNSSQIIDLRDRVARLEAENAAMHGVSINGKK